MTWCTNMWGTSWWRQHCCIGLALCWRSHILQHGWRELCWTGSAHGKCTAVGEKKKKKEKYFFYSSENKWFAVFANTQPGLKNNTPVWIRMTASYSLNCKVMWAYPLALSTASLAVILHALCSVLPCLSSPPTPYHFVLGTVIVSANSRPLLKSTLSSWKYNWKISSLQWLHT